MAKSKNNPITPERTIPKLELMAVHTAVLLLKHVADPLKISWEDIYIWTDSKTAIQWLRVPEGTLQVLAHNYCKKIKKGIYDLDHVKWMPGPENPADVPTRPKTVQEIVNIPMWTKGPRFLHLDPIKWPSLPILEKTTDVIEGMNKEFQVFDSVSSSLSLQKTIGSNPFDMNKYSSLAKLKRIFAYAVHYLG
jgi:hypothetical protein